MTGNRIMILAATIAIIGSFLFYSYGIHPIVECGTVCPPVIYGEKGSIKLTVQNIGRSGVHINLHAILCNATISEETRTSYGAITPNEVTFNLFLVGKSEKNVEEVHFCISENAETFQVICFVEKDPDLSLPGAIDYLFGELKPSSPITCEYERGGPHSYIVKLCNEASTALVGK